MFYCAFINTYYFFQTIVFIPAGLYIKAGLKSIGSVFLMTDAQVAEERFLVLINDLLASGEIPDLLADDELENVINGVRGEVSNECQKLKGLCDIVPAK